MTKLSEIRHLNGSIRTNRSVSSEQIKGVIDSSVYLLGLVDGYQDALERIAVGSYSYCGMPDGCDKCCSCMAKNALEKGKE